MKVGDYVRSYDCSCPLRVLEAADRFVKVEPNLTCIRCCYPWRLEANLVVHDPLAEALREAFQ